MRTPWLVIVSAQMACVAVGVRGRLNDLRSLVEFSLAAHRGQPVASASSGASPVPVLPQPAPPGGITFDVLAY